MFSLQDLEKKINSELTTKINTSKINHSQIFINIDSRLVERHNNSWVGKGIKVFIKIRSDKFSNQFPNTLPIIR